MNKVVENGQVAVLFSPSFGAGWYTWNSNEELLFDPILVELVKVKNGLSEDALEYTDIISRIHKRAEQIEPNGYWGAADDLSVTWLPEGSKFIVEEYDGSESIMELIETRWITA